MPHREGSISTCSGDKEQFFWKNESKHWGCRYQTNLQPALTTGERHFLCINPKILLYKGRNGVHISGTEISLDECDTKMHRNMVK